MRGRLLIRMDDILSHTNHFKKEGYLALYSKIFGSLQYPYWLTLQIVWSCYVVIRSTKDLKKNLILWIRNLVISALMSILPRELFAYFFQMNSPIMNNPATIILFLGIYSLISLCPYDIIYKLLSILYYFIGFLQGANQTRFLTRIIRRMNELHVSQFYVVPIAMTFTCIDQIFELIYRMIFDTDETRMSNITTIVRTCLFSFVFYLATFKNYMTKYIGIYSIHITALVLAFTLGLFNASAILNFDNQERVPKPPPTPKLYRRSSSSGNVSDHE